VKEKGGITKITTKFSTANKETRIIVSSGYAKEHFLFKDTSSSDKEYKKAIQMLCSYTMAGKNKNDDIPDSMAMLVDFVDGFNRNKIEIFQRPF
jgi:predicted phage terminase large subunit-like protein